MTVNVNAAPPAVALVGEMDVSVGTGFGALAMLKTTTVDVPPPGAGLVTVTLALPAAAMSAAVMAAVSCVALTNVVVFAVPLNFTAEDDTKPVPLTVSVKAAPPAVAPVGESEVIAGAGLLIVKVCAPDAPPPGDGFVTVTDGVPAVAISAAVMAAVICVALTKVVVLAAPLKFTTEAATKLVPLTVRVKAAPPAVALVGESEVIVGARLLTVKLVAVDVPPPGAGFVTVTPSVPAVAMSAAVIEAVTWVALTNVVVRALPLNFTLEEGTNPVPFTVRVKPAPPAVALVGDSVVIVGAGLFMVNDCTLVVPPPGAGFVTVTLTTPPLAMSAAVMAAVTCVALTKVVVLAAPLKFTTEVETKFVPVAVSVKPAPPAVALVGEIEVSVGTGLFATLTLKATEVEVPPPGAGFVTVTGKLPAEAISAARMAAVT